MEETRARELVDRYGDLLVRLGYTWLGDLDDAQDVCQTVLLKLLEDDDPTDNRVSFVYWSNRIL